MRVFITGANGFIGGSVAALLASRGHHVRGLIRGASNASAVSAVGVEPVIGTLDHHGLLTAEAQAADAVVNAADSDHAGAIRTLLAALGGTGKRLLHTSGSSIIADQAMGEPSDATFAEDTPIAPEPDKAPRVALDRSLLLAAPDVHTVVLCNSLIYGHAMGAPAESVQLPALVAQARESGIARFIGRGLNVWSTVHISDVAELYAIALERAPPGSFYYVENGEASFSEMVDAISRSLRLGSAASWSAEEAIAR